jgi:predicted oxidoreductase
MSAISLPSVTHMNRVQVSPTGPTFSAMSYGTWRILDDAATATAKSLLGRLQRCLDLGITTLDTAEIYGLYHVEETIGAALKLDTPLRSKLEIVSKAGIYVPCEFHPDRKTAFYNATAARLIKSTEKSLRLLGTDYLDCLLVHRPDWLASIDDTAEGLNKLVQSGKVRSVGVSNYSASQFAALSSRMDQPLITNQIEINLLHMDALYDGTLDQAQELSFKPMAWSPLAGGRLFDAKLDAATRLKACAKELSAKYGDATLDQLAYAWIMAHPSRPMPVIGTNQIDRIQQAAKAAHIQLEREDWYALWTAAKGQGVP